MNVNQLFELLYRLSVVKAIFKYLIVINIFNNILNKIVDGIIIKMFDNLTILFNTLYNKYRFDTIDKRFDTIDKRFEAIENDITDMKNKLDNIEVLLVQLLRQKK